MKRWSAPGSILLAGEYWVTEEGGLGLALAAGGRAHLVHGDDGGENARGAPPAGIFGAVCNVLPKPLAHAGKVSVDTSNFFTEDGRKWGLGSSAAAVLLIARFLSDSSDQEVLRAALCAHRNFQGGRGSGYDVYTSAHGGFGLFRGGARPSWKPLAWPENILGCLIRGPSPISSASAVERYSRWAAKAANEAAALRSRMDETLMAVFHQLTSGGGSDEVFSHFTELGRLGARLGDGIGVPARPHIPRGLGQDILGGTRSGAAVKCVGAGDELTLLLYRGGALSGREIGILNRLAAGGGAMFLRVEKRGLSVEIRM